MKGYRTIEEITAYTDGLCDGANRIISVIHTSEQKILESKRLEKKLKAEYIAGRIGIFFKPDQWTWITTCIRLCTENGLLPKNIKADEMVNIYDYVHKLLKEREES